MYQVHLKMQAQVVAAWHQQQPLYGFLFIAFLLLPKSTKVLVLQIGKIHHHDDDNADEEPPVLTPYSQATAASLASGTQKHIGVIIFIVIVIIMMIMAMMIFAVINYHKGKKARKEESQHNWTVEYL